MTPDQLNALLDEVDASIRPVSKSGLSPGDVEKVNATLRRAGRAERPPPAEVDHLEVTAGGGWEYEPAVLTVADARRLAHALTAWADHLEPPTKGKRSDAQQPDVPTCALVHDHGPHLVVVAGRRGSAVLDYPVGRCPGHGPSTTP